MKKHKNIILFLVKFFVTYFVLFAIYLVYLQNSQESKEAFTCSSLTTKVAKQTVGVLNLAGYNASYQQHEQEMSVKLLVNNTYVARVIEGCNSGSLIILFIAFIVAFSGSIKATFIYSLLGSLFIYFINIFRIAFLTLMLYKYPGQQGLLHNLVFPGLIYGTIFILWVVWVKKFSHLKNE